MTYLFLNLKDYLILSIYISLQIWIKLIPFYKAI